MFRLIISMLMVTLLTGCANISIFGPPEPLRESLIQGTGPDKVLVLPIQGTLRETPKDRWVTSSPSTVQTVSAQLNKALIDPDIKALFITVDSPGGTTTASDIIYHEIKSFKKKKDIPVACMFMGVAASGGYYLSLAADEIYALPTSITGSVGVIFVRPKVHQLMDKIGVDMEITKSGSDKDMMSPFRPDTVEEKKLVQQITMGMADRFFSLVQKNRNPAPEQMKTIKTARIFNSQQAKNLNMVDEILYPDQGLARIMKLAGIKADSSVIAYRRTEVPEETLYTPASSKQALPPMINADLSLVLPEAKSGFYYLWLP